MMTKYAVPSADKIEIRLIEILKHFLSSPFDFKGQSAQSIRAHSLQIRQQFTTRWSAILWFDPETFWTKDECICPTQMVDLLDEVVRRPRTHFFDSLVLLLRLLGLNRRLLQWKQVWWVSIVGYSDETTLWYLENRLIRWKYSQRKEMMTGRIFRKSGIDFSCKWTVLSFWAVYSITTILAMHTMASDNFDPYTVLGLSRDASDRDVRKSYKTLARKWYSSMVCFVNCSRCDRPV